ncbi:MAG TPA: amidase, partial [Deltaproteobacteria bacterium]|nr:amidase [Deltaproteobacteria bacterium]
IKECFALEGMPQTGGLVARRDHIATTDATAVHRLRSAGAIPIGVTNVSELCMWMETSNALYGRSKNPYAPSRIVGGSSGGEGAIVGAGASPFGLGADIGGSIRMPAFFNGGFGHKPSGGLVPGTGQWPIAENEALRYLTTGPIARRAEDLMPLLRVLAGPDGVDTGCEAIDLGDPNQVALGDLRVLHIAHNGNGPVHQDLAEAQVRCVEHLQQLGATIGLPEFPKLRRSYDIWSASLYRAADTSFADYMGYDRRFRPIRDSLRWFTGTSPHTLPALALAVFEKTPGLIPGQVQRWMAAGHELRQELETALGTDGVLLFPSYPRPAPRHYRPLLRPLSFVYTAIFNILQVPVTQVPLGLNQEGLPVGIQVVAAWGQDHLTIAVAQELERAFGGWVPPPRLFDA